MTHAIMAANDAARQDNIGPHIFEGRTFSIVDIDGEPWFLSSEIARELGYREAYDLTRTLDADEKGPHTMRTPGGEQETTIISEPALYRAILQRKAHRKHDAELTARLARFQRWVFHDVLPSIRKIGSYGATAAPTIDVRDPAQLATIAMQLIAVNRELGERVEVAEKAVEIAKPKAEFFDKFADANGLYGLQNAARVLGRNPNVFIAELKRDHLFYQGGELVPKARYAQTGSGLFFCKATLVDGRSRHRTFMTPKGLQHFARKDGPPTLFDPLPSASAIACMAGIGAGSAVHS